MGRKCRHFMAVLGTSLYTDCVYEVEGTDFNCRTPYAQLAVLKYMEWKREPVDKISILLTDRAKKKNWTTRPYEVQELEDLAKRGITPEPGEQKPGLKEILSAAYPGTLVRSISIPEGNNQKELDDIFDDIYREIEPEETICFDFTHGLRNIPMQVLTIINYAKALKKIQVGGMYYGAYELGRKIDNISHVNLLDMTACSVILDWTSAAQSFVESGNSTQIWKLYEAGTQTDRQNQKEAKAQADRQDQKGARTQTDRRNQKEVGAQADRQEQKNAENAVLKSLYDLTSCISACRGKTTESAQSSIRKAYEEFNRNYQNMMESGKPMSAAPLSRLFDQIKEDLKIFQKRPYLVKAGRKIRLDSTATGLAAVEWAINKEQTQLGFTALEEVIVTLIGEQYELPAEDQVVREDIIGQPLGYMIHVYGDCKKKKKPKMAEEELERTCREAGQEKVLEQEERLKEACELTEREEARERMQALLRYLSPMQDMVKEVPMKLICLASNIVQLRNTLNHFGYQKTVAKYATFKKNLEKQYQELQEIMEAEGILMEQESAASE